MNLFYFCLCLSFSSAILPLENSGSSNSSSPRSPRSPREELEVVDNVIRTQERDKKGRIRQESYSATLKSGTFILINATFDKKNNASYVGFWRRGEKAPCSMTPDCAETYFGKLKRAYLENKTTSTFQS